jgi:hypothetical protein
MADIDESLFKLIPESQLQPQQIMKSNDGRITPLYELRRCPISINEFHDDRSSKIVNMPNGALLVLHYTPKYISAPSTVDTPYFHLLINHDSPNDVISCLIRGRHNEMVAEATAFLWSLKHERQDKIASVLLVGKNSLFDLDAFQSSQLASLFDVNPTRRVIIFQGSLQTKIAKTFVTRPYLINLELNYSKFEDGGASFVRYLQERQSCFGALSMVGRVVLAERHMSLLCHKLHLFESLELPLLSKDHFIHALTAPVKSISLVIDFDVYDLSELDFSSFDIVAEEVKLDIWARNDGEYPEEFVVAFLQRVAELGHFKALTLLHARVCFKKAVPKSVGESLVQAVAANPKLKVLDISREVFYREIFFGEFSPVDIYEHWDAHLKDLLHLIEDHAALETLKIPTYPTKKDPNYSWLNQLLKRNKKIRVVDRFDELVTDGALIDQQYALNRFSLSHEQLKGHTPSLRSAFIGTSLVESASANIARTASLLFQHTDVLCDLVPEGEATVTPTERTDPTLSTIRIVTPSKRESESLSPPRSSKRSHLF